MTLLVRVASERAGVTARRGRAAILTIRDIDGRSRARREAIELRDALLADLGGVMLTAHRHSVGTGLWSVLFENKLLVERSRDPECDACAGSHGPHRQAEDVRP